MNDYIMQGGENRGFEKCCNERCRKARKFILIPSDEKSKEM